MLSQCPGPVEKKRLDRDLEEEAVCFPPTPHFLPALFLKLEITGAICAAQSYVFLGSLANWEVESGTWRPKIGWERRRLAWSEGLMIGRGNACL